MINKLTICFCILVAISLVVLPLVYVAAIDELSQMNSVTCGPNGCHMEYTNYTNYNNTTQGGE